MEVFYNELSNQPLAADNQEAKERIISLLETMNTLRGHDVNIMRTHDGFYAEQLSDGYSFSSFLADPTVRPNLKILLRTIVANPFIKDIDSDEAETFITHTFSTQNHVGRTVSPEGLAGAYAFSSPAISIASQECWKNNNLQLTVTPNDTSLESRTEHVLNLYSANCVRSDVFCRWIEHLAIPLNSKKNIYSVFPDPPYRFEARAIDDILFWFYGDKRYLIKIKELLEDIPHHPFTGGKGQTEVLKGSGGKASKKIVKKDRMVYTYTNSSITIHQCRGHYDDD